MLGRAARRLVGASGLERIGIAVASTALALLIGVIIVAGAGYDPVAFIQDMLYGAVGSNNRIASTLKPTTSFILAGVAVAIAFRAGVFNIGVQGQFIVGGFAATLAILGLAGVLPGGAVGGVLLIALGCLAAIVGGGLYGALPGVLKAYAGANEIITTIMLNFIAEGVVFYLIDSFLRPDGAFIARTERFPDYVQFPMVYFEQPSFSLVGLAIAVLAAVVVYLVMERTGFGYDLITTGYQQAAATYSGMNAKRTVVSTMTFSGMVAGLGGAVFVIMTLSYYSDPSGIPTFGFDAIAVSLLAANNPLAVLPSGLLFGALESGGNYIGQSSSVPRQLIDGIVGLVVLFVAAPELFRMGAKRVGFGGENR